MYLISPAYAARVSVSSPKSSVTVNESVSIPIQIQTGQDSVSGTDVYIQYDKSALQYEGVKDLHFFSFVNAVEDGDSTVHVSAVVGDVKDLKKGSAQFATVMFKAIRGGTSKISIICDPGTRDSSKIIRGDLDATDIIDCAETQPAVVTVSDTSLFRKAYTFLFGWLK